MEYAYLRNIIPIIPDINQSKRRNGTNTDNITSKHNMGFNPVEEYYRCPYSKIENTGIHEIKGKNKRVYKGLECLNVHFTMNAQEIVNTEFS